MSILSLPEEIQEEVILRLTVKFIFRCKCVCKLWCNLISSPKFTKDILRLTSPNTNLTSFIFVNKSSLCYVEYNFENHEQFCEKPTEELFNLSCLGNFDTTGKENINIVGSCNGLVCLATKISKHICHHVYICNPITQEFVQLPGLLPNSKDYIDAGYVCILYGFGCLPSSNQYKVVRISYKLNCRKNISSGKVHVYTLGEGRGWRDRGETNTYLNGLECHSICVDGAVYWFESVRPKIVVFDVTEEKFYMLPTPPRSPTDWGHFNIIVLGGQLCIFQATTYRSSNIWLLKKMDDDSDVNERDGEDRHPSSIWNKGSTVTVEGKGPVISKYRPLAITKNGYIIMLYREKWNQAERKNVAIHYDPKTLNSKDLGDLGLPLPGCGKATVHINSYISLKSLGEQTVFARLRI